MIFAFDIDGTLLTSTHHLTEGTIEALRYISEKKNDIVLCTSRSINGTRAICRKLSIDCYLISFQGAALDFYKSDSGKFFPIARFGKINLHNVKRILRIVRSSDVVANFYYENACFSTSDDLLSRSEREITGECFSVILSPIDLVQKPLKILMMARSDELLELVSGQCSDVELSILKSKNGYREIVNRENGKWAAIMELVRIRKLHSNGPIVAFGDAENDVEMLKNSDIGIAMGNSAQSVKPHADYVTESNEQDGVAKAIHRLCRIGQL